jgi:hypothetical protein
MSAEPRQLLDQRVIVYFTDTGEPVQYTTAYTVMDVANGCLDCARRYGDPVMARLARQPLPHIKPK